jgi:hypothetical protein
MGYDPAKGLEELLPPEDANNGVTKNTERAKVVIILLIILFS